MGLILFPSSPPVINPCNEICEPEYPKYDCLALKFKFSVALCLHRDRKDYEGRGTQDSHLVFHAASELGLNWKKAINFSLPFPNKTLTTKTAWKHWRLADLIACTTTILNSSEISDMKVEICFIRRSTEVSLPVFSRVVMARVAMLRFTSVMRFSRSRLQAVTAAGCFMATWG